MSFFSKQYRLPLFFALLIAILYGGFAYDLDRSNFIKLLSLFTTLFFLTYYLIKNYGYNFWLLAGIGIVFRLIFIPVEPNLSQDFYRFIWDGRLVAEGINPYLFTPNEIIRDSSLVFGMTMSQAQELIAGMGSLSAQHFSNYPPVNQLCFAIAGLFAGKSILGPVIVLRILIILADIGILYFGKKLLEKFKLPVKNIFWYFLNPFIIIELTGNLHFEGVMLFFLVVSLFLVYKKYWILAAVAFALSISTKLIPLLFLPLFFNYFMKGNMVSNFRFWKLLLFYFLVIVLMVSSFIPFINPELMHNYSTTISLWFQKFEFNASVYYIIRWIGYKIVGWNIIAAVGKVLPILVILFIVGVTFFRKNRILQQLVTSMLLVISIYFLFSTTVHPWYIATPLLFSVFTSYKFPIVWSAVIMLSYSAYGNSGFSENLWLIALEYCIVIGFAIWELFIKKKTVPTTFQT